MLPGRSSSHAKPRFTIYLLPHLVEQAAEKFGPKEAFRFKEESLSYDVLNGRMNSLANVLISQGVQKGDRVGIYLQKSLECAVAIYGIMRAGAVYVPIDPSAPIDRVAFVIEDCAINILVTHDKRLRNVKKLLTRTTGLRSVIGLDDADDLTVNAISWSDVFSFSTAAPAVNQVSQDLAYIIYTSGSTGEPKGIMHTHGSGMSYAQMAADLYELSPNDRLSNFPPLHFDQSTFDYFSGVLVGASTVIIPDEFRMIPASLSRLMEDERITVWYSVPFALIQLLLHGALDERDLSHLRWAIYGGEPFSQKHLRALQSLLPNATFSNNYGPAETNQVTYFHIPTIESVTDAAVPIGHACPNVELLIADDSGSAVNVGEEGELLIRTPTMMQGYWKRPDRNAGAFFDVEALGGHQLRYYRSGDLVRRREDGLYDFVGRKDRQVKTRGYRVELDEVESSITLHEMVAEAAVFAFADDEAGKLIYAGVLLKPGCELDKKGLLKFLALRLPKYSIPTVLEFVNEFPRTTSGKIDRRQLHEIYLSER